MTRGNRFSYAINDAFGAINKTYEAFKTRIGLGEITTAAVLISVSAIAALVTAIVYWTADARTIKNKITLMKERETARARQIEQLKSNGATPAEITAYIKSDLESTNKELADITGKGFMADATGLISSAVKLLLIGGALYYIVPYVMKRLDKN
jgi:predicted PurR-regulated permease PerM